MSASVMRNAVNSASLEYSVARSMKLETIEKSASTSLKYSTFKVPFNPVDVMKPLSGDDLCVEEKWI